LEDTLELEIKVYNKVGSISKRGGTAEEYLSSLYTNLVYGDEFFCLGGIKR